MGRLRGREVAEAPGERAYYEAIFRKPAAPLPRGYTLNSFVTEWLTETCIGDWASQSRGGRAVVVRFFAELDFVRARARFMPNRPWRAPGSRSLGGFEHRSG